MPAAVYTPESIYSDDTWPGIPLLRIRVSTDPETEPAAPATPAASVRLCFHKAGMPIGRTPQTGHTLTNPDGVTILSAGGWEFSVPRTKLPLDAGEWAFRFAVTDEGGFAKTYVVGSLNIL
jgi:hypothetical protein